MNPAFYARKQPRDWGRYATNVFTVLVLLMVVLVLYYHTSRNAHQSLARDIAEGRAEIVSHRWPDGTLDVRIVEKGKP